MFGIEYRPKKFEEIIGQDTVVKGIQTYLKKGDFPQVSVFIGNSGCGKSTTARLVAMTLNCDNPIKTENGVEPCCECSSCKDILEEIFTRDVKVYNGANVTIDKVREIENDISYDSMHDDNHILILEEAQLIKDVAFKSFLDLLEKNHSNTYFILTSTDKKKFSNSFSKDNKSQEQNAFRSRLGLFNIKSVTTECISNHLFKILNVIDPDEKLPDDILETIPFIAQNSKNNVRQALNDLEQCINCEVYDKKSVSELLNYTDDEKENEIVYLMAIKSKDAIKYIKNSEDLEGNFRYWNTIISNNAIRDMSDEPFTEEWQEKSYQRLKATNNIMSLFNVFVKTHNECSGYFDPTIFISNLYKFYKGENERFIGVDISKTNDFSLNEIPKVKKIKKVVV